MSRTVIFSPEALAQLDEDYISQRNASTIFAERYIDRLVRFCRSIALAPYQGRNRDDLAPGLRTTGLEHRMTILFEVRDEAAVIAGLFYGGRKGRHRT